MMSLLGCVVGRLLGYVAGSGHEVDRDVDRALALDLGLGYIYASPGP